MMFILSLLLSVIFYDVDINNCASQGVITTVAGNGSMGFSGDNGTATTAQLHQPFGVCVADGVLYIADQLNHRVRAVKLSTGVVLTFAFIPTHPGDHVSSIHTHFH